MGHFSLDCFNSNAIDKSETRKYDFVCESFHRAGSLFPETFNFQLSAHAAIDIDFWWQSNGSNHTIHVCMCVILAEHRAFCDAGVEFTINGNKQINRRRKKNAIQTIIKNKPFFARSLSIFSNQVCPSTPKKSKKVYIRRTTKKNYINKRVT